MRFTSIILTFFLINSLTSYSQIIEDGSDYQNLFDLYVFANYEKCLKKALRYTDNDNKRRDPEPFLFASVIYLKIHENPEDFDPNIEDRPLKEALKYAYRFKKRDDLLFLQKMNDEYLQHLRVAALEEALRQLKLDKNRKAAYYLKYATKLNPDDYVSKLAQGMSQTMGRNKYEGKRNLNLAYEMIYKHLDENKNIAVRSEASDVVSEFLMKYLEYWENKNNEKKYLQTLSMAHLLLNDNAKFWENIN